MTKIRGVRGNETVIVVFDPAAGDPTWSTVDESTPICVLIEDKDWEEATGNALGEDYRKGEPVADIIDERNKLRVALFGVMNALSQLPVDPRDLGIPFDEAVKLMRVKNVDSIGLRKPPPDDPGVITQEQVQEYLKDKAAKEAAKEAAKASESS